MNYAILNDKDEIVTVLRDKPASLEAGQRSIPESELRPDAKRAPQPVEPPEPLAMLEQVLKQLDIRLTAVEKELETKPESEIKP